MDPRIIQKYAIESTNSYFRDPQGIHWLATGRKATHVYDKIYTLGIPAIHFAVLVTTPVGGYLYMPAGLPLSSQPREIDSVGTSRTTLDLDSACRGVERIALIWLVPLLAWTIGPSVAGSSACRQGR